MLIEAGLEALLAVAAVVDIDITLNRTIRIDLVFDLSVAAFKPCLTLMGGITLHNRHGQADKDGCEAEMLHGVIIHGYG